MTLFRNAVDFALWSSEDQVLLFFRYPKLFAKFRQVNFGLILNLILHRRQVHRDIASVSRAQGFNDMDNVYGTRRIADDLFHPLGEQSGFFCEVGSENNG